MDERPSVVVIHHVSDWRSALASSIAASGIDVEVYDDPRDGLDRLRRDPKPRLVLTALETPFLNGLELVHQIHRQRFDVPCIVMARSGGPAAEDPLGDRGAESLEMDDLLRFVDAVLQT